MATSILDTPLLATPTGGVVDADLIQIYDVSAPVSGGSSPQRKLTVGALRGLAPGDVLTVAGTSATLANRLTVFTSTSAVAATLPAASGAIRELVVMKASATSAVTVNRAGSDTIVSGTSVSATSVTVNAGLTAIFWSDGTTWYHISNDA